MTSSLNLWQFWIDRGGTFTDIVARRPDGSLVIHKLLSDHPERYPDAALQGVRDLLKLPAATPLTGIEAVKMGTTVGTNALLERKGEPTVLAITQGFADALRIGHQNRPDIFALDIRRPEPLYDRAVEVPGRLDAHGQELQPLDLEAAERGLRAAYNEGFRAVAIVLMHAWRNPAHELALEEVARRLGYTQISLSHWVSPAIRLIGRGDTTVVDAYLSPVLRRYVVQVADGLAGRLLSSPHPSPPSAPLRTGLPEGEGTKLLFMQSNGGLVEARQFHGKDSILSGPAGGIVGAVAVSRLAGFEKIVTFDMGGTSTDVAHYSGELERSLETEVAGVRLRTPMLNIHTVAAGGGSILHYDGLRFRAGPDSAGANPGPACYRRGGPLTVTDANVMVGKLRPEFFPQVFGPDGNLPLDAAAVAAQFAALAEQVGAAAGQKTSPEAVAEGFIDVAVEHMAAAIKRISVQRGHDIADHALYCFGAAGGQHACRVADRLGIRRVLLHPLAGVLSAYGMGLADYRVLKERAVVEVLNEALTERLVGLLDELETEGRRELLDQAVSSDRITARRRAALRYEGTDTLFTVDFGPLAVLREAFEIQHRQRFGFVYENKRLLVESAVVEVVGLNERPETACFQPDGLAVAGSVATVPLFSGGVRHATPVYRREALPAGIRLAGPALLIEATSTTVIEPGWAGEISGRGDLVLSREAPLAESDATETQVDPVRLEIFNRLFMSVAEEMGHTLQNTAHSVNIKERLDFSCALFDGAGELVANAPHIPVHLGSMGESVKALIRSRGPELRPGDVWLLNSPYHGGTHLPDITVITPLFIDDGGREASFNHPHPNPLPEGEGAKCRFTDGMIHNEANEPILFYLASRGHHADVGGITPGSMPPNSTRIDQEGALSDGLKIVEAGRMREDVVRIWLTSGPYPARNPDQNLADLRAQIAANAKGAEGLRQMVARYSLATVWAYMNHVQNHAEEAVRRVIAGLSDGEFTVTMDSGAVIRVAVKIDRARRSARIDFTGTSPEQPDNLNAPAAVCQAAVLYVFRTLVREDIPLNAGCLRPLDIVIPEGSLLNPRPPAAVVAGNVETSQNICDALYGALGVLAASQGTMNNFTFGNAHYQYYETICGGAGAGADFDGADAVHTHMTNSRITDPEVLEWRFPVRLETFAIRRGSGGAGQRRGGDGVVRRVRFLEPMTAGILSGRRVNAPFGLRGGAAGSPGRNTVIRADGTMEELGARAEARMNAGDVLVIETPGGGGFGEPSIDNPGKLTQTGMLNLP
ncbi:hydantoinase B/oxoprolinase family protein [Methylomagnum sp.]